MKTITNHEGIPLALAVWLVHDEYDYLSHPAYISATGLMKPLRHIILPKRQNPELQKPEDVTDFISRGLGHAIHDSMEKAWAVGYRANLAKLGYPQDVIDRVIINPSDADLDAMLATGKEPIPVHLERRMFRRFNGKIIGGKFDAVTDGIVNDTKSTSAYAWMFGGRDEDYQIQGSIYRWIDAKGLELPEDETDLGALRSFRPRITEDYIRINFVFTDWSGMQARQNKGYPQKRVEQREIKLLPEGETEMWIREKLRLIERFKDAPESEIPECTPEELWQSDAVFKYYKNPQKTNGRSTRNFDNAPEAYAYMSEQGNVGVVKEIPGEPKRCAYCPAFDNCTQKDRYF